MSGDEANIFDVAKKVSEELKKLEKDDCAKVLRWVAESLGENMPRATSGATGDMPDAAKQPLPPAEETLSAIGNRPKDIKIFLAEKQPKSDNQYAAAVAYYYRFVAPEQEHSNTVTAEMLQDAARLAGRKRLGDPNKTLANATAQGYLDNISRGQYGISTVGENLVAMTLPSGSDSSAPRKKKQQTTKKKVNKKSVSKKKTSRRKK